MRGRGDRVPFVDLIAVHQPMEDDLRAAFERVFASGAYTMGAEAAAFEDDFAHAVGASHALGVGSGTAALQLLLCAVGVQTGDEVIVPPNSFVATAEAVVAVGATPVFADVDPLTGQIDPSAVDAAVTSRTAAVIAVHLYGHPAPMDELRAITSRAGILLLEDSAQAFGASYRGRPAGSLAAGAAFSFYPGKNLGALGEAGAVTTDDARVAARVQMLRAHGEADKHDHLLIGTNARLDELQAAFLRVKLTYFDEGQRQRAAAVARYHAGLVGVPQVEALATSAAVVHANHLLPVRVSGRDRVRDRLDTHGVDTAVHYPTPIHLQPAFAEYGDGRGACPVSEALAASTLSLPLFAGITDTQVDRCVEAIGFAVDHAA
jgi:dTDP-3-amino-3,4,6-trideoxy-alpha-D-glucose transaminase